MNYLEQKEWYQGKYGNAGVWITFGSMPDSLIIWHTLLVKSFKTPYSMNVLIYIQWGQ